MNTQTERVRLSALMVQTLRRVNEGRHITQPVQTLRGLERRELIKHRSGPYSRFILTERGESALAQIDSRATSPTTQGHTDNAKTEKS